MYTFLFTFRLDDGRYLNNNINEIINNNPLLRKR